MNREAWFALFRKDLRLFVADRRALMITLIVPIAIASFSATIFGGGGSGGGGSSRKKSRIPIMIADRDNSPLSREIVAGFSKEDTVRVRTGTAADARRSVLRGEMTAALVIPPAFGEKATQAIFAGNKPTVMLLYDPSHQAEMQMLRGLALQHVMQAVSKYAFGPGALSDGPSDEPAKKVVDGHPAPPASSPGLTGLTLQMPVEIKDQAVTAKPDSGKWSESSHAFAGMAVQALLFLAIDSGIGMLRDRQRGLWKRLRAAPLSRNTLLSSKVGSTTLISMLILTGVFGFGAVAFHIRIQGSFAGFALICIATGLMAASFGLLIAALGRSEQQSRGYAVPATLLMVMLGGGWIPAFMMPQWMQSVSLFVPSRWAIDGFDAVTWRGLGLTDALRISGILFAFALVFGVVARMQFRWDGD